MLEQTTVAPGSKGEKKLQKEFKTTADAMKFYNNQMLTSMAPLMQNFINQQEMMFVSTADSHGECDCTLRTGDKGFVIVLDERYLLYPEYKGNGVAASMGNITENPNIALLFIDFFDRKIGLHVNGKATIIKKEDVVQYLEWFKKEIDIMISEKDRFKIISYILVEVEEAYMHCSMHIPLLRKIDPKRTFKKFPKDGKGGDAFGVANMPRAWEKK